MNTTEATTSGLLRVLSESLATRRVFGSGVAGLAIADGHRLLASEVQPHRAALVRRALRAYSGDLAPVTICADGTRPAWPAQSFAAVMADVPCTGLGALRRRPESRWRRKPADVADLVGLQQRAASFVGAPDAASGPFVQLWPHRHGTDAMFLALLHVAD